MNPGDESEAERLRAKFPAEDESEAERLRAKFPAEDAGATAFRSPRMPGMLETAARSGLEGLTAGFSGELLGANAALEPYSAYNTNKPPFSKHVLIDNYRQGREGADIARNEGEAANPTTARLSEFAGAMLTPVPGMGLAKGASLINRAVKGAGIGALLGGLTGLGKSQADLTKGDIAGAFKNTGVGGATGGATGAILGPALGAAGSRLENYLKTEAENKALQTISNPQITDKLRRLGYETAADRQAFSRRLVEGGYVKAGDSAQDIADRVDTTLEGWGEAMGGHIRTADASGLKADFRRNALAILEPLKNKTEVELEGAGPVRELAEAQWRQGEVALQDPTRATFDQLRRAKSAAQGAVNWQSEVPLAKELHREGARALRRDFLGQIKPALSPLEFQDFETLNENYSFGSDVANLAGNAASRHAQKNLTGPIAGIAAAVGGAALGSGSMPALGGATLVGAGLQQGAQWLKRNPATVSVLAEKSRPLVEPVTSGLGKAGVYGAASKAVKTAPKPSGNKRQDDEDAVNAYNSSGQ